MTFSIRHHRRLSTVFALCALGLFACDEDSEELDPLDPAHDLVVGPGERIQDAVAKADPGDVIQILPGTYTEAVLILEENITIEGIVQDGERPILDGQGAFENGIEVRPPEAGEEWPGDEGGEPPTKLTGFTLSGIETRNYTDNGVFTSFVDKVVIRDVITVDTGAYGIFPVLGTDILVENCVTSGAWDTGVYCGQSRDVVVRGCEAFGNTSGIEIENTIGALVEDNDCHDNTAGILAFVLPGLSIKDASDIVIRNNKIENNNGMNLAPDGAVLANVPVGTGILLLAADEVEITGNSIKNNNTMGIGMVAWSIFDTLGGDLAEDPDVEPNCNDNRIHGNTYEGNGSDPDPAVASVLQADSDLVWDGQGTGNCYDEEPTPVSGLVDIPVCE